MARTKAATGGEGARLYRVRHEPRNRRARRRPFRSSRQDRHGSASSAIRMNLFTRRDLMALLDNPFATLPAHKDHPRSVLAFA